jgi:DNA replication licensing factor MCM3
MAELDIFSPTSSNYLTHKRDFTEFLDQEDEGAQYQKKIIRMLETGGSRLYVSLDHLRNFNPDLAQRLMQHPMEYFAPWQAALKEYIKVLPEQNFKTNVDKADFRIGIDGNFGMHRVDPRHLKANHVGNLMCVEGIVTRCSIVRPKIVQAVNYCPKTNNESRQVFHDATSITGFPTGSAYSTKDQDGNPLETEYGLSTYLDTQTLTIQEMPERAPPGLLPKSVDVILEMDLVDAVKPGDRVMIAGIYRALPGSAGGETTGNFRTVLLANMVQGLGKSMQGSAEDELTEQDIKHIREVSRRKDLFELLGKSIAPSIHGHIYIKKALGLLLLGGLEKNLDNGTHIRGDINMMMIGDPSTAKSQILRFVLNVAPLSINTTGRGSSGVGLTAAVIQDQDTGERKLEAGAMVLADRGVVCIDEFDKMSDNDRVSIHEVMEQQTVTIAKAGIHMSLNARCSVIAAANPAYGQYDRSLAPSRNINMPDSLLSRFDLLFIVLDQPDPEVDRDISDRVIRNHRYLSKHGEHVVEDAASKSGEETAVYQRYDKLLHGSVTGQRTKGKLDLLTIPFLKKYIRFAKDTYKPILSEEAADYVGQAYKELRSREQSERALPVTARALETLIRLSTAHAKMRMSKHVTQGDAAVAVEVLKFAMENDVTIVKDTEEATEAERPAAIAGRAEDEKKDDDDGDGEGAAMDDGDGDDDDAGGGGGGGSAGAPRIAESNVTSPQKGKRAAGGTPTRGAKKAKQSLALAPPAALRRSPRKSPGKSSQLSAAPASGHGETGGEERVALFAAALGSLFTASRTSELDIAAVVARANSQAESDYGPEEVESILEQLQASNKCLVSEGMLHRI